MAQGHRSPFGELVYRHRRQLSLTQLDLAMLAINLSSRNRQGGTLSERTVAAFERRTTDPGKWTFPRPSTVRALAQALGLDRNSPEYAEFVQAAEARPRPIHGSSRPGSQSGSVIRRHAPIAQQLFVPDGREPHLARLHGAIEDVVNGIPGVMFVSADPGVGKTSVIEEVCRRAVTAHGDLVVLWGDCTGRSGASDPHQPFRQALGVMSGDISAAGPHQLVSTENERRIRRRIPTAITALIADGDGLIDRLVPGDALRVQSETGNLDPATESELRNLLDSSAGSRQTARGLNEQVFRVLARYAAAGPVILVLEDLHWADIGTASLLFHVMRRLHEQHLALLVLGSFRSSHLEPTQPGDRHPFPPVLHEAPRLFDDTLVDLSSAVGGTAGRAFVDAVVAHRIDNAPRSLRESLFEQTAGLPLFVLGMLRWYQVMGRIRTDPDGVATFQHVAASRALPTEIDALFADLVNRLPHDLQALLEAASVQGAIFSAEIVMRVQGLSQPVLIEMIDYQLTHRFKVLTAGGVSTIARHRHHDYQFTHALLRDYLYYRMTDLEREHYHLVTAEAMQVLYGLGQHNGAARIAFHFDQAGDHVNAAAAYLKAGDHAMEHSDFEQAARFFGRIGELDLREKDPLSVAQALVGLGNCARDEGDSVRAAAVLEHARDLAERAELLMVEANCLASMSMLDFDAGRMGQGAERLNRAIGIFLDLGNLHAASRSLTLLSHVLYGMGYYDEAGEAARRAIGIGTELRDDLLVVGGTIALTNTWIDIGLYVEAITMYEKCIRICEEHGTIHRATLCWLNIALCEIERANWDRSFAALESVFISQPKAISRLSGAADIYARLVAEGQGNLVEAEKRYRRSLDIRLENGQDAQAVDSLAGLLRVATAEGQHQTIRELTSAIVDRIDTRGLDGVEHAGRLFVSMITAYGALGDSECAHLYVRHGVAFLTERADRLADPVHRESYLSVVPSHRQIFELAHSVGVSQMHSPETG